MDLAIKHAKAFNGKILVVTSMIGDNIAENPKFFDAERKLEQVKAYI